MSVLLSPIWSPPKGGHLRFPVLIHSPQWQAPLGRPEAVGRRRAREPLLRGDEKKKRWKKHCVLQAPRTLNQCLHPHSPLLEEGQPNHRRNSGRMLVPARNMGRGPGRGAHGDPGSKSRYYIETSVPWLFSSRHSLGVLALCPLVWVCTVQRVAGVDQPMHGCSGHCTGCSCDHTGVPRRSSGQWRCCRRWGRRRLRLT